MFQGGGGGGGVEGEEGGANSSRNGSGNGSGMGSGSNVTGSVHNDSVIPDGRLNSSDGGGSYSFVGGDGAGGTGR